MRGKLTIGLSVCALSLLPVNAQLYSESDSWNSGSKVSSDPLSKMPTKIIRRIDTNQLPVSRLVTELSKTVSMNAIIDKSVEGRTISTNYTDATVEEILRGTFSNARLQSKLLDDNTFLVESQTQPPEHFRPKNVGDYDKTPPLSIEVQRQEKINEEKAARARKSQEQYYKKYYPNYSNAGFVPPPPPTPYPWP